MHLPLPLPSSQGSLGDGAGQRMRHKAGRFRKEPLAADGKINYARRWMSWSMVGREVWLWKSLDSYSIKPPHWSYKFSRGTCSPDAAKFSVACGAGQLWGALWGVKNCYKESTLQKLVFINTLIADCSLHKQCRTKINIKWLTHTLLEKLACTYLKTACLTKQ